VSYSIEYSSSFSRGRGKTAAVWIWLLISI
jgi:hypothetical protein